MAKYVQLIGYQLQTAAEGNMARKKYPGSIFQKRDIERRCAILADAIRAAKTKADPNKDTLKLFVAPEFFFRGGTGGAYDITNIPKINEIMDGYIGDAKYKDWIFILGTAIAALPSDKPDQVEIFNIALVRKGGVKVVRKLKADESLSKGEKDSVLIYKEYVSDVDYFGPHFGDSKMFHRDKTHAGKANIRGKEARLLATDGARPSGLVEAIGMPNISDDKSEESQTGLGGGSIFEMNGYRFVIEICLDHVMERAKDAKPKDIDFHIVTSCGMERKYVVAKKGGFFFIVDGSAHLPACIEAGKISMAGLFQKIDDNESVDMTQKSNWQNHKGDGTTYFQNGRGTVYVFNKQSI